LTNLQPFLQLSRLIHKQARKKGNTKEEEEPNANIFSVETKQTSSQKGCCKYRAFKHLQIV